MKRKKIHFTIILIISILLLGSFAAKHLLFSNKAKTKIIKPIVKTTMVSVESMHKTISLFGKTKAVAKINIVNKYAGTISAVHVDLGDEVEAGEMLLEQDLKDIELKIAEAKAKYGEYHGKALAYETEYNAQLERYKATYELHKTNYERYLKLHELGAVSKLEVDNVKQTMLSSKANYEELAQQVMIDNIPAAVFARMQDGEQKYNDYLLLQNQRADMTLKAPRKGTISFRNAEVGNYVPAGTKLFTIVDNSSVYVDCVVSENDSALLKVGQEVEVDIEALGHEAKGKIIFISPAASDESNGFSVRLALESADANIKEGLFAKSKFNYLQKENTISLNRTAIIEKNGKDYVFVLNKNNKVEQREIKIGIRNDTQVEITKGISAGEWIVTTNLSRLRNGMSVEVAEAGDDKL
ncbi:MAG: efflux RND transporter periplasmic adaptor subunit [Opitutales bacterium]|nr:efflux RND transporter periplasmic adaptor subunit [Opitutales bacterium]